MNQKTWIKETTLASGVKVFDWHQLSCGCWFFLEEAKGLNGHRTKVYEINHIEHAYLIGTKSDTSRYVDCLYPANEKMLEIIRLHLALTGKETV